MNQSKQLLACLRHGDFAHPGEIDAIDLAMQPIAKNPNQNLLDVGCGLGGSAHYMHQQGFGHVVGIDLDDELIRYAKKNYVELSFVQGDVGDLTSLMNKTFQVICCFSSFFSFPLQQDALHAMASVANRMAELVIFDYSKNSDEWIESPFHWSKTATHFNPIYIPQMKEMLSKSGWYFKNSMDVTLQFEQWYEALLQQFENRQIELIKQFDPHIFDKMYDGYRQLLLMIKAGTVGGVIVHASRETT
jgi:phosphoethanolamine N-methyltransferase